MVYVVTAHAHLGWAVEAAAEVVAHRAVCAFTDDADSICGGWHSGTFILFRALLATSFCQAQGD